MTRLFRRFIPVLALFSIARSAVALTPPPQTYVLEFGPGPGQLAVPDVPQLRLGAQFTLEAWLFLEAPSFNAVVLGRVNGGGCPRGEYALYFCDKLQFGQSASDSSAAVSPNYTVPLRQWTHVAGVLDGSMLHFYVNGIEIGSVKSPGPPLASPSDPFLIGSGLNGALRQVRVWSRALTAAQLSANAGVRLTGAEPGLLAYWPLDDGRGVTALDRGPAAASLQILRPSSVPAPRWIHTAVLDNGPFFTTDQAVYLAANCFLPDSVVPCLGIGAVIDFDHNGAPDVVVTRSFAFQRGAPLLALRNDGNGHFTDVTGTVFSPASPEVLGASNPLVADFNGDGFQDLFVGTIGLDAPPFPGAQSLLFLQTANGQLRDVTATNLPQGKNFDDGGAAAGDFNNDGALDFYFADLGRPALYINDGSGRFTADTADLPAQLVPPGKGAYDGAVALDVNKDGKVALALGSTQDNNRVGDVLLINDGRGHFSFGRDEAMPPRQTGPNGITNSMVSADFDGDGWPDILEIQTKSDFSGGRSVFSGARVVLLLNNHDGTFRDASANIPQAWEPNVLLSHIRVADFNGDGKPDFLVEGQAATTARHLFLNIGGGNFVDASEILPADLFLASFELVADFDGNGSVDILTIADQWYQLVRNLKPFDPHILTAGPCVADFVTMCSQSGRFEVRVDWINQHASPATTGIGTAIPNTDQTGVFWFFSPQSVELVVKIIDGRAVNGNFWVFYGALSDVEYTIQITDRQTGNVKTYRNPPGNICGGADTSAFPATSRASLAGSSASFPSIALAEEASVAAESPDSASVTASHSLASCSPGSGNLCLLSNRFQVLVTWINQHAPGQTGVGTPIPSTDQSGYFWFFSPESLELVVKLIDGRAVNGKFWVFYGALSDVEYTISVTDTLTGSVKTYHNTPGNICGGADTNAF